MEDDSFLVKLQVSIFKKLNCGMIKFDEGDIKHGYSRSLKEENIVLNFDTSGRLYSIEFLDIRKLPFRKE